MTTPLLVDDMASYLEATGWRRRPETWRGASIWDSSAGYQALVPARDGLDDAGERTWELLHTLSEVEGRSIEEIAADIATPTIDSPFIRTYPAGLPSGEIRLAEAARALDAVREILSAAGRVELEDARPLYTGTRPAELTRLFDEIRLGPTKPGSYIFTLRVSAAVVPRPPMLFDFADTSDGAEPLSRRTLRRLFVGVAAAHAAADAVLRGRDYSAFDETIGAGVSVNLCRGLSDLSGQRRQQRFDIGFRWARGVPSQLPARTITFAEGAGLVMFEAAKQLERLAAGGPAQITGQIDSLHDEPQRDDRWRVRIRGELRTREADLDLRRPIWIRLDAESYQRALDAHRAHRPVTARGHLQLVARRVELVPEPGGFVVSA